MVEGWALWVKGFAGVEAGLVNGGQIFRFRARSAGLGMNELVRCSSSASPFKGCKVFTVRCMGGRFHSEFKNAILIRLP